MNRLQKLSKWLINYAILVALLALSGCSILAPQTAPPTLPEPQPADPEPEIVVDTPPPVTKPAPRVPDPEVPEPPQLPPVAIVLTSAQPAYADVARELARHFKNFEVYDLSETERPPVTVLRLINDSDSYAVVAIGLRAARSSIAMSDAPVVFSQVFNYQDYDLLTEKSRGVAAIAPLDAQIDAWRQIDPTISRIGAIIGEGHDDLIIEAELATERHGIDLQVHVSRSDQETLYFFKRMIHNIDGFWLFPDNRILSRRALQQIMEEAERQRVPVLASSEAMLQIGASISVSSVASDIAETITRVIRQIQAGNLARVPAITPLSRVRVTTNKTPQVVDR